MRVSLLLPTVLTAGTVALGALVAPAARADTHPRSGTPRTAAADVLPTAQTDGVVYSMVTVGTTVYATGDFRRARPAGVPAGGRGQVSRVNILAFSLTTGRLLPFKHTLNGVGRRIVASPTGNRVYVGGDFTEVDGQPRSHLAAFSTSTGRLDRGFAPAGVTSIVRGLAVTADRVYAGATVSRAGRQVRTRLAAFSRSRGELLAWAPTADSAVTAIVIAPGGRRVIVGGKFQHLNSQPKVGIGAVDARTGRLATWTSRPVPANYIFLRSWVTDLTVAGGVVYGAADGEGLHMFDGRFAATAATGRLVWLDNCYGATYGVHVTGSVLYSVGHAHDCRSLGAFPDTRPVSYHRILAETTAATRRDRTAPGAGSHYQHQPTPTLLHWFPTLAAGSASGQVQGAWAITGAGRYLAIGGEFPTVNGKAQQGLARFALKPPAPGKVGPRPTSSITPVLTARAGRRVTVAWRTTWDQDNAKLSYEVLRDGHRVATFSRRSSFWRRPKVTWTDTAPTAGLHAYRIRVKDPDGNRRASSSSLVLALP